MYEDEIATGWIQGTPWDNLPKKYKKVTRASKGGWAGYNHNLQPADGTLCMSYNRHELLSYEHWSLARRLDGGTILVNGDGAPSRRTGEQQRALQRALTRAEDVWSAVIPFTTLVRASINPAFVTVVATTPDVTREFAMPCRRKACSQAKSGPHNHSVSRHFLGECLFLYRDRRYLSGLDRNDDPQRRMFYLCRLPVDCYATTVEAALESLRPAEVPLGTPRQGEWFFLPCPELVNTLKVGVLFRGARVPITSDVPDTQVTNEGRPGRHVASTLCVTDKGVYARGVIHDREHTALRLGDVWHRVVQNRAEVGWRYVPGPGGGARVD